MNFVIVPKKSSTKKIYVRKEGVSLKIIFGTRSFTHQKRIWNYKWNKKYKHLSSLKRIKIALVLCTTLCYLFKLLQ